MSWRWWSRPPVVAVCAFCEGRIERGDPVAEVSLGRTVAFEIAANEETERRAMEAALLPLGRVAAEAESRALIVEAL